MARMNRAGRKEQIKRIVYQNWKRDEGRAMECWKIARKLGLKSSTNIKTMCKELAMEDDNIWMGHINGVFAINWLPMTQMELPPRFITINGKSHQVSNWVFDPRECK